MASLSDLLRRVHSKVAITRAQAVEQLGLTAHPSALSEIERLLEDPSPEVRSRAAEALGNFDAASVGLLIAAVRDPDELVRVSAVASLGLLRKREALPVVRQILRDPSPLVRSYAATALARLGTKREIRALRSLLDSDPCDTAKIGIYEGLWLLGEHSAFEGAISLLNSPDHAVRCAVVEALAGTFLTSKTSDRVRLVLRNRLRKERTRAVTSKLNQALRNLEDATLSRTDRRG
jgi:HEAT repeat protein